MCRHCDEHTRVAGNPKIAKPSARLTPEEDAARFVLAWEQRMIRNGRAWRTKSGELRFYAARGIDPGPSVPQSTLMIRPAGCECPNGEFAVGEDGRVGISHDTSCPLHNAEILRRRDEAEARRY